MMNQLANYKVINFKFCIPREGSFGLRFVLFFAYPPKDGSASFSFWSLLADFLPSCPLHNFGRRARLLLTILMSGGLPLLPSPLGEGWGVRCFSQDAKFSRIGSEQKLSQASVNCILQDSKGLMWFGTQDGLNRYDGYDMKVFKNDPSDTNSLSGNWIDCLYEDRQGVIWVGTRGG